MKYFLIAGEASGDLHASNLMAALKEQDAEADFRFLGGDLMQAVGGTLVKHYRDMAYGLYPRTAQSPYDPEQHESLPGGNPAVQARCGDPDRLSGVQFEDCQICKDAVGAACLLLYLS